MNALLDEAKFRVFNGGEGAELTHNQMGGVGCVAKKKGVG